MSTKPQNTAPLALAIGASFMPESQETSNLVEKLSAHMHETSYKFNKSAAQVKSPCGVWLASLNRVRKDVNDVRELSQQEKVTQYDAFRMVINGDLPFTESQFNRTLFRFSDQLCDILGVSGRPTADESKKAWLLLASDYSQNPSNTYTRFEDLATSEVADRVNDGIEEV
jgi:hypothetical protein